MFSSFGQKLGTAVRNLLPLETALVFLLLGVLVWPIPYIGSVSPSLSLVAVYYWSIYRPDLFRPSLVFVLGLVNDVLNFLPIGLSACVFLGVHQLSFSQRRFLAGQIFYMLWAGFAIIAFLAALANWSVLSLKADHVLSVMPVFLQYIMTVALFPLPAWVLIRLQRNFLTQR